MKLSLGFSPCPNDTFIFDALVNKKIDTGNFEFEPILEDVQTLNTWAAEGKLDITKLSFPALFDNQSAYSILDAGSALGKGVGPLLIGSRMVSIGDVNHCTIAIPGWNTTAHFLLCFAFPGITQKKVYLFSEIEDAVLRGEVDLGVIIHENRFTYRQKGLHKICDLGEVWEERQQAPIPLGCIAVKKGIDQSTRDAINRLIHDSLQYAFDHYPEISPYVKEHAQAMDTEVMKQHIDLYVNNYSLQLGEEGRKAILQLQSVYQQQSGRTANEEPLFSSIG